MLFPDIVQKCKAARPWGALSKQRFEFPNDGLRGHLALQKFRNASTARDHVDEGNIRNAHQ